MNIDYRTQQARPWLERVRLAAREYHKRAALLESLHSTAEEIGAIDYTHEHVTGGEYDDHLAERVDGLNAAQREAETALAAYKAEVDAAAQALKAIDPEALHLIASYYLSGADTLADAAKTMNYERARHGLKPITGSTLYKRHRDALLAAYEVTPAPWRDPRPRAY